MIPYSHALNIPTGKPFENKYRWTTFLGKFVKPIVENRKFPYWFSYYGPIARFRVHTEDQSVARDIDRFMHNLGLTYTLDPKTGKRVEEDLTLEQDLGSPRFLGAERMNITSAQRALKVLSLLHAGAELFLHSLVSEGDYWREEICKDANNPYDSASRSYIHLLHNLAQSDIQIWNYVEGQSMGTLSDYYFADAVANGKIKPVYAAHNRVRV